MRRKTLINEIFLYEDHVEIKVTGKKYCHKVLLDVEDLHKIGRIKISNTGYAYTCSVPSKSVAHIIMNHVSNMETVVDHINGNTLDNRKRNLRIVTQHENSQNKRNFVRNNTGVVGISFRKNGKYEYYRVSLTNPNTPKGSNRQRSRITKQFNINKLGKSIAFQQAIDYLEKKKKELGYLI